ncbi:hypothetical protein ACP70R_032918 [Stipagrostis hirtigluma subsp. patula]
MPKETSGTGTSSKSLSGDADAEARRPATIEEACVVEDETLVDPSNNSFKEQLGYANRDYLYYRKRCGNNIATVEAIDFRADAEAMLEHLASERETKVRLIMSKEQEKARYVDITPLKRPREFERDDDEDEDLADDEEIDEYKEWLEAKGPDTVTYKNVDKRTREQDDNNGSSPMPETQWPAHARKTTKQTKDSTTELNDTTQDAATPTEPNDTTENEARSTEDNIQKTALQRDETPNQLGSANKLYHHRKENVPPNRNPKHPRILKNLFGDNNAKSGAPAKYITTHQLVAVAQTRASKKKKTGRLKMANKIQDL